MALFSAGEPYINETAACEKKFELLSPRELVGDYEILANFNFGGVPYELVYERLKCFADKVMPTLKG
jgi:hypothetical protein